MMRTIASSIKAEIQVVYSRTVFSHLAHDREWMGGVLWAGRFSDVSRSAMASNVSLRYAPGGGVETSSAAVSNDCIKIGWFQTTWEAFNAAVIWQRSRIERSGLLTMSTPWSYLCRVVAIVELHLMKNLKKLKEGKRNKKS